MTTTSSPSARSVVFRDLNGNGVMDPYEDPSLPVDERVEDLVQRMTLAEKAGLMMHTVTTPSPDGHLDSAPAVEGRASVQELIEKRAVTHLNVHRIPDPRTMAQWVNRLQRLAAGTRLGIPVTISTDPRHSFAENWGASFNAEHLSAWPEPIGLAALGDEDTVREFADIARQEYLALGIRSALHPTLDLATEPRWARQYSTFGQDADVVARLGLAYVEGFQGDELSSSSVACMAKHFPGGGPQRDGEDPHFPYGREQDYPGDMFEYHLEPFRRILERGISAIMPSYGIPMGLSYRGEPIEEVGFGFNRQIITDLLRQELGFDGVVCADWGLITQSFLAGRQLPARAWGVEHLTEVDRVEKGLLAGLDQFGGEDDPRWIIELVESGRVPMRRIDESVRRLLRVKFALGLFDDPFVDEDAAAEIVGRPSFRRAGHRAQVASTTVLVDDTGLLPLATGTSVFAPEIDDDVLSAGGLVPAPSDVADVIVTRIATPFEPRDRFALEASFHAGSLEFPTAEVTRHSELARRAPVVVVAHLERPALLAPLLPHATAVVGAFGSSDAAVIEALTTPDAAQGRLPFDIPRSMAAIRTARPDVPGDTDDAIFRAGS